MYQIEWEATGLAALADLCLQHRERWADINGVVDIIEYLLGRDPLSRGRHIAEGLHRIDSPPLAAYFTINGTSITIESIRWIE
jgi:hypothetical protein